MSQTRWSVFREDAIRRAKMADPEDRWVTYGHPLANARSAQSTAGIMRLRFPDLEIKTRKGVIYARVRPVSTAGELVPSIAGAALSGRRSTRLRSGATAI